MNDRLLPALFNNPKVEPGTLSDLAELSLRLHHDLRSRRRPADEIIAKFLSDVSSVAYEGKRLEEPANV